MKKKKHPDYRCFSPLQHFVSFEGLFAGKLPGLDCVSFGPDMKNIHTSRESMDVASVQRTWKYTLGILEKLK
jgi:di/tripeptidase